MVDLGVVLVSFEAAVSDRLRWWRSGEYNFAFIYVAEPSREIWWDSSPFSDHYLSFSGKCVESAFKIEGCHIEGRVIEVGGFD